jgi:hypothetical protein
MLPYARRVASFLLRADRSFHVWVERLPEWGLALLLPPIVLVVMVEWACFFRRTTAATGIMLVAVYAALIRAGAITFSRRAAMSAIGSGCIEVMGQLYVIVLPMALLMAMGRLLEALWPSRDGKRSPDDARAAPSLWDREFDG